MVSSDIMRASQLAIGYNAIPLSYEEALITMPLTEVIIGAIRSKVVVLTKKDLLKSNALNPQLFIDLGMPRNFDPDINSIGQPKIYHLDTLKKTASRSLRKREKEVVLAKSIIEEETVYYQQWLRFRKYVPLIQELKDKLAGVKEGALKNMLETTPHLCKEQQEYIEDALNTTVKKILSKTIVFYRAENDADFSMDTSKKHSNQTIETANQNSRSNTVLVHETLEAVNI